MATAECLYWYKQALEHIKIDQFAKAAAAIDCAINADPSCAEAWDIKSLVHCCQQDFNEAIVALDHALELAPNAAVHWRNKAIILQSLDNGGIENWTIREEAQIAEMWATELEEHPETVKLPVQAHIIVHALAIFLSA